MKAQSYTQVYSPKSSGFIQWKKRKKKQLQRYEMNERYIRLSEAFEDG